MQNLWYLFLLFHIPVPVSFILKFNMRGRYVVSLCNFPVISPTNVSRI